MNLQGLADKVASIAAKLDAIAGKVIEYTPYSRSTAQGDADYVKFSGDPSDQQRTVKRVSPWGVSGRPKVVDGVFAGVAKALSGSFNGLMFGVYTSKFGPGASVNMPTLAEGELLLWCSADGCYLYLNKDGKPVLQAAPNQNLQVVASGTGQVQVTATALTGKVALGPVGSLPVLVQGTMDSWGVPVTQAPAAINTIVMAG